MDDTLRSQLEARRAEIAQDLAANYIGMGADSIRQMKASLRSERAQIDVALAQLEVAASQRAVAAAQQADVEEREAQRAQQDDAAFWLRRFILSLGVANAAGFLALAGGTLQADEFRSLAHVADKPLYFFALGMVAAGAAPFFLYMRAVASGLVSTATDMGSIEATRHARRADRSQRMAVWASGISALFFVCGLMASVQAVSAASELPEQKDPPTPIEVRVVSPM